MATLCRKLKLYVEGDKEELNRVYTFIRNGQYAQYQVMNLGMGLITSSFYANGRDLSSEDFQKAQNAVKNSNPIFAGIDCAKGVDTLTLAIQKVKSDFSTSLKNGLARGERSINNYKRTNPLLTRSRNLRFYSNYDNPLVDASYLEEDFEVYIRWVNNIVFKVALGKNLYKSQTFRKELRNIILGDFKVCGSSISIVNKCGSNSIILNLAIQVPEKSATLNNDSYVGVCLGITVPAVCALSNSKVARDIGKAEDFFIARQKIQAQHSKEQSRVRIAKGGHGRKKKLKALERFELREKNFASTYNHFVSRHIVDFAKNNNAKYIVMEAWTKGDIVDDSVLDDNKDASNLINNPKGTLKGKLVLRNWSYYQLQQYVEYKAKQYGIQVLYIDILDRNGAGDEVSVARQIANSFLGGTNPKVKPKGKTKVKAKPKAE